MLRSARVLFLLSVLTPASLLAAEIIPSAAPRGARVVVTGDGLDGASVLFTGTAGPVPARIVVRTSTFLEAVVPSTAATGSVTVGGNGTLSFTLLPDPPIARLSTILASDQAHDVFKQPAGVVVTASGIAYVADAHHNQIRTVSADGRVLAVIGDGSPAQFKQPLGIAIDAAGQAIYVADTGNNAIRRLTAGSVVSTLVGPEAGLKQPAGIAVDASGDVYVADSGNGQIRLITPAGAISAFAGGVQQGFADGPLAQALFKQPTGIAIDSQGAIYVADSGNNRIRRIAGGVVSTVAGTGHGALVDGATSVAEFKQPSGISIDEAGDILVADSGNHAIRKISAGTVSTIDLDGFKEPFGIDARGAVVVSDSSDDALRAIYSSVRAAAVYPRSGASLVRIFGTGFVPGATSVTFGEALAPSVTFVASTEVLAAVPAGTGSVDVKVSTPAGSDVLAGGYTYLPPPTISTIDPRKGKLAGGDAIAITGTNFVLDTTVAIGGAAASGVVVISPTSLTAITPPGLGLADVSVATSAGTVTKSGGFVYFPPPAITSFAPVEGGAGTAVAISGQNFDPDAAGDRVFFGALPAAVATASPAQLAVTVPGGASSGKITVTTAGGSAQSAVHFVVTAFSALRITSPTTMIDAGTSIQLNAIGALISGGSTDVTSKTSWTSNNEAIRVTSTGIVTAVAAGFADISASFGGFSATIHITAHSLAVPPDPAGIAPKPDLTVVPMFADEIRFLYTGANAIQTGVAPNSIADDRAAVVRGTIHSWNGAAARGVHITALKHPEWGQTTSRADGAFDFAINGGGTTALRFERAGSITVQRPVSLQWNEQTTLPDVVLTAYDTQVTEISGGAAQTQIARSTLVTDRDGSRQATILFPSGTSALLSFPDGSSQAAPALHIRATEFTVGSNGPHAMPAALPRNSAYTYCVELSADEAVAAGADVHFSKPLSLYVDNFLGFRTGTVVPVGYYDRAMGAWVPSDNGVVLEIVSVANGLADVDVNGDGNADSALDESERRGLAAQYAVGKTLWRIPVTHFSSWDANWGEVDPDGQVTPNRAQPSTIPAPSSEDGSGCTIANSIVNCYSANVFESIPIVGTPFALEYDSSRISPAQNSMTVSLSGATVPESLKRIDLTINIAGRSQTLTFPPQPNLAYDFSWDGIDVYGRRAQGARDAGVALSYVYDSAYIASLASGRAWNLGGSQTTNVRGRQELSFTQLFTVRLGHFSADSAGFGGWTLSPQQFYDGRGGAIYESGGERSADPSQIRELAISTYAGNTRAGFSGDGGPATQATLRAFNFIAAGPDGSLYIADSHDFGCFPNGACGSAYSRIRRVDPQTRVIDTIAGNGHVGFTADGALALGSPVAAQQLAAGPDGSLYFVDLFRVRRIVDGVLTTIAGNGTLGSTAMPNDGAVAAQIGITPRALAVDRDGSVYVALSGGIIRVSQDGLVSNYSSLPFVAALAVGPHDQLFATDTFSVFEVGPKGTRLIGGLERGVSGHDLLDGQPAASGSLSVPNALAVTPDGTVLVSETGRAPRIRAIGTNGIATTLLGNGRFPSFALPPDGLLARSATIGPWGIAAAPDGSVYILDQQLNIVRRAAGVFPAAQRGLTAIPSREGSAASVFQDGRHVSTVDTLTGVTLSTLGYDANGFLTSLTDLDNNVVAIERASDGSAAAIVAPGGQRTTLRIADGHLVSVINPANEEVDLAYNNPSGLLTDLVDPRKGVHHVTYDAHGSVVRDEGPDGNFFTLTKSGSGQNYTVTRTTAEGRSHVYKVALASDTAASREHDSPDGTLTKYTFAAATTSMSSSDGTSETTTDSPDARFGMAAPFLGSGTFSGGGKSATLSLTRTLTADANNPFAASLFKEKFILNGQTWVNSWEPSSRTIQVVSPAGRTVTSVLDEKTRLSAVFEPLITRTTFSYSASGMLATIDQGSRNATFAYDGKNRLTSIKDPLGRTVRLEHDLVGRITSQTLADGRVISFGYDAAGNLTSLTPPGRAPHRFSYTEADLPATDGGATQYAYNKDRDLTLIMKPDGKTIRFAYDSAGRLGAISIARGSYRLAYNAAGQVSSVTAPDGGQLTSVYNGPLLSSVAWSGDVNGSVSYSYDNNFRVASETAGGLSAAFNYDADGLLIGAGALKLARDSQNGLLTGSALGAISDKWTYDEFGDPLTYAATAAGAPLLQQQFTRNSTTQIVHKDESVLGESHSYDYSYDSVGRLAGVTRDGTSVATYAYDTNGNRLGGTYDDQDRMLAYGEASYTYSANGELSTKTEFGQTTAYTYDELGNLLRVVLPAGATIDYVVDGRNRRVGKKVNGTLVRQWLYGDALRIVAELDGSGALISRFVYGSQANVPDSMIRGGAIYRIVSDHLGSPRLIAESTTGSVAQWIEYDAFGTVMSDTNPGFQPFGFAGGLYDADTGLVRFGARDYDARTGRWLSKDPIGFGGLDANLYSYAFADPVNLIDPGGTTIERCFRIFDSGKARVIAAAVVLTHPSLLVLQPPVPGVRAYPGHEYLYNAETHQSQGYDPNQDRQESGDDLCYKIPEPLGQCVWKNFRRIAGPTKNYNSITHNCQITINDTVRACRAMLFPNPGGTRRPNP